MISTLINRLECLIFGHLPARRMKVILTWTPADPVAHETEVWACPRCGKSFGFVRGALKG